MEQLNKLNFFLDFVIRSSHFSKKKKKNQLFQPQKYQTLRGKQIMYIPVLSSCVHKTVSDV